MSEVALVGYGYLGQAYHKVFPDAVVYDEPKELFIQARKEWEFGVKAGRTAVNACDMTIVAVPTDPMEDGSLNMSIVEEVVDWIESDTILIKSALMPGTVDRLVEKTGKNIAVSVEYIGLGNYYMPPEKYPDSTDPRKHRLLVVGGQEPARTKAAEKLWAKMSPDTRIHLVSAKEAEITKLVENAYGALKVTFANCLYNTVQRAGESFINVHQAWSEDGRTDPMHTRVVSGKRGWQSHCYDKDIQALVAYARSIGAVDMALLFDTVVELNEGHLGEN
jgi:UDP-glucose 6-dehydrogenase